MFIRFLFVFINSFRNHVLSQCNNNNNNNKTRKTENEIVSIRFGSEEEEEEMNTKKEKWIDIHYLNPN